MSNEIPKLIAINHDDDYASFVGLTTDGKQFFLTTPFVPTLESQLGREFVALYIFDLKGNLLEARIDDFGARENLDEEHRTQMFEQRLSEIQPVEYGRIEVKPFSVEKFGVTFGLIPQPPENDDEDWWVTVEPGNFMAFCKPWEDGEYYT